MDGVTARERQNAYSRAWYARNREQHKAAVARWREENPEKAQESLRAAVKRYGASHRDVLRRRDERRRLRMRGAWSASGDEYAILIAGDPCVYCGGPSQGVDHIIPIADGGLHSEDNLAPACLDCNRRKRTRSLLHFLLHRPVRARWTG